MSNDSKVIPIGGLAGTDNKDLNGGTNLNSSTPTPDRKTVDGFIRRPGGKALSALAKPGRQAASAVHHKLQRSQALMRNAVNYPASKTAQFSSATINKVSNITKKAPRPIAASETKSRAPLVDFGRLERARATQKHSRVLRFGRAAAVEQSAKNAQPSPVKNIRTAVVKPVMAARRLAGPGTLTAKPLPSLVTSASHHRLERMLDWALANADAHKQELNEATRSHRRIWSRLGLPKWLSIGLVSLVAVLLIGFIAYEKSMAVGMQVARLRSGVAGTVPAYSPAGFKVVSPPAYSKDVINLNFKSTDSARHFSITERPSSWDSQSLLENYVKSTGEQYQVSQTSGKTVFTYGTTNATWVDNHIWYDIQNSAELNADEVTKIANSL